MRFVAIEAEARKLATVYAEVPQDVYELVGLDPLHVDHGVVYRSDLTGIGVAIVVFEHGLFAPPEKTFYFSIGRQMFAGNAILYAFDGAGETIDMPERLPPVMFYKSFREVERAIERGDIDRPATFVNGAPMWSWPNISH
jgi:hypothetical protein